MCGNFGVLGEITQQHKDIFKDGMRVASLRGIHSAGVVAVDRNGGYKTAKEVGAPDYLFDTKRYDQATTGLLSGLIGHCRHKTSGEINRQNAHPFEFPNEGIAGVHNGTLRWYSNLDGYSHNKVDSEVLYHHLAHNGPENTFNQIEGAWACVWFDEGEGTINFIRNKERPLFFAWTKDLKCLFWASEAWMLTAVERKLDLYEGTKEKPVAKIFPLPLDTLWSFEYDPQSQTKVVFKEPKKIEPKEVKEVGRNFSHGNDWEKNPRTGAWEKKRPVVNINKKDESGGEVVDPFKLAGALAKDLRDQDNLDDPIEDLCGASDKKSMALSDVPFMLTSAKKKDMLTASNTSKDSKSNIRYLPSPPTRDSVLINSAAPSSSSAGLSKAMEQFTCSKLVDLRTVAGEVYITDRETGTEYSFKQFEENTNLTCSFCHNEVKSLSEVNAFISKNSFVCQDCMTAPDLLSRIA